MSNLYSKLMLAYDNFDKFLALRGIAALIIVVYHAVPPREAWFWNGRDISWLYFGNGNTAVIFFFLLSGYLISKGYFSRRYTFSLSGLGKFWWARIVRIFPLYYFALFITVVFVFNQLLSYQKFDKLASLLFFYFDGRGQFPFVPSFWAISTEVQFYVLAPFLAWLLWKVPFKKLLYPLVFVGIAYGGYYIRSYTLINAGSTGWLNQVFNYPLVGYLDSFLMGMAVYPMLETFPSIRKLLSPLRILGIGPLIAVYLLSARMLYAEPTYTGLDQIIRYRALLPILAGLGFSVFIYLSEAALFDRKFTPKRYGFKQIFSHPLAIFEWLGVLSYGVYLWHMVILGKVGSEYVFVTDATGHFLHKVSITIFLSLVLATATYYLVELPFVAKKHSKSDLKDTAGLESAVTTEQLKVTPKNSDLK